MPKIEKLVGDHVRRRDIALDDDGAVFEFGEPPSRGTRSWTCGRLLSRGSRPSLCLQLLFLPVVVHTVSYFGLTRTGERGGATCARELDTFLPFLGTALLAGRRSGVQPHVSDTNWFKH